MTVASAIVLALLLLTVTASADEPAEPKGERETAVSTSPRRAPASTPSHGRLAAGVEREMRPLTRAAARRSVEEMSPTGWLERYGSVSTRSRR